MSGRFQPLAGLRVTLENARREGWPVHVATRATCAEHMAAGDDVREGFAFSSPQGPPQPGDIQRRCWTVFENGQCGLYNGHGGPHFDDWMGVFRPAAVPA